MTSYIGLGPLVNVDDLIVMFRDPVSLGESPARIGCGLPRLESAKDPAPRIKHNERLHLG